MLKTISEDNTQNTLKDKTNFTITETKIQIIDYYSGTEFFYSQIMVQKVLFDPQWKHERNIYTYIKKVL